MFVIIENIQNDFIFDTIYTNYIEAIFESPIW